MLLAINWRYCQTRKNSRMRMQVQSYLIQACFIEILQVFAKKNWKISIKVVCSILGNLEFKRKIRTLTGIRTSDLEISSQAFYHLSYHGSIDGLNLSLQSNTMQGSMFCDIFTIWQKNYKPEGRRNIGRPQTRIGDNFWEEGTGQGA